MPHPGKDTRHSLSGMLIESQSLYGTYRFYSCVPLATEPNISLIILTPMNILQRNLNRRMLWCRYISYTMRQVRFKFRCNILISGKIIKEISGSVASGTHCTRVLTPYHLTMPALWYSLCTYKLPQKQWDSSRTTHSVQTCRQSSPLV
jgi:hypothetical protein